MFNLFRKRDTVVRYLLMGLLGMVALSMVTYLIPNYNDPLATSANPVLAEVGNEKLYALDVQSRFERSIQGQIPNEMREIYFPQFLDQLIQNRAAVFQAKQLGLNVSDDEVRSGIALSFPTYYKDGKLDRAAFDAVLAQQGVTATQILDQLREQLLLRKLQDVLMESTIVSPSDVEAEYRKRHEKVTMQYVAFAAADLRGEVKLTDEDVRKRYEVEKNNYRQPEKYGFRAIVLEQDKFSARLQLTESEVRAAYNSALDNFRVPERVHARHILLGTEGKSDADKKVLLAKAQDLVKQARAGADFADLARKNSTDSNANDGGDLGTFARGEKAPDFQAVENAVFTMKPGEISDVVTTKYGYHVLHFWVQLF